MSTDSSGKPAQRNRIVIVRHAESAANAGLRTTDPVTIPITERGVRQARFVADLLAWKPTAIVVSRYLRTQQTAIPIRDRFPDAPVEQWPIEEFTYLDQGACEGTSHAERTAIRDAYWNRCDPLHVDGPGCECFVAFTSRVRWLYGKLCRLHPNDMVVVLTHAFVIKTLLWLQHHLSDEIGASEMAGFYRFNRLLAVPNCAVLRPGSDVDGQLHFPSAVSISHIPPDLRTL